MEGCGGGAREVVGCETRVRWGGVWGVSSGGSGGVWGELGRGGGG